MSEEHETVESYTPTKKDIIEAMCSDRDFREVIKQAYQDFYLGIKHTH